MYERSSLDYLHVLSFSILFTLLAINKDKLC